MPRPVYKPSGKTKRSKVKGRRKLSGRKQYVCKACLDTGISSRGTLCVACQRRKGAI